MDVGDVPKSMKALFEDIAANSDVRGQSDEIITPQDALDLTSPDKLMAAATLEEGTNTTKLKQGTFQNIST